MRFRSEKNSRLRVAALEVKMMLTMQKAKPQRSQRNVLVAETS